MPFVQVTSSTGQTKFKYTICTPTCANAKSIKKNVPVLLFIHPMSIAEHIFHCEQRSKCSEIPCSKLFACSLQPNFPILDYDVSTSFPLTWEEGMVKHLEIKYLHITDRMKLQKMWYYSWYVLNLNEIFMLTWRPRMPFSCLPAILSECPQERPLPLSWRYHTPAVCCLCFSYHIFVSKYPLRWQRAI